MQLKPIEYFCIKLEAPQIRNIVTNAFEASSPDTRFFWDQLVRTNRVQSEFHITLIHCSGAKEYQVLWKKYCDMYAKKSVDIGKNSQSIGQCRALLEVVSLFFIELPQCNLITF